MKEKIQQFLDQLNERERNMVYAAAVFLLVFLPYQFIWTPFTNSVNELGKKVETQEQDLLWMQAKVPEIKQLGRMANTKQGGSQSLYAVIEKTARKEFGSDIRVQQEGKNGVRVIIKETSFDDMLTWLDDLQFKHGAFIKEFKIDSEKGIGRVKASILLEG